jgi:hypothetical protein
MSTDQRSSLIMNAQNDNVLAFPEFTLDFWQYSAACGSFGGKHFLHSRDRLVSGKIDA